MRTRQVRAAGPLEVAPEETVSEAARSFKVVQLRLLMKEREDASRRLIDLDYAIWVLEEYFRSGTP